MTDFDGQDRKALEEAYQRDVKEVCGPEEPSNKVWHRQGFEAGYRAAAQEEPREDGHNPYGAGYRCGYRAALAACELETNEMDTKP
jgi:hypothetical protein